MTHLITPRYQFGTLRRSPQEQTLKNIEKYVGELEQSLGYSISVTAQIQSEQLIKVEVYLPDKEYNYDNITIVSHKLGKAGKEFGIDIDVEVDSDI